MKKPSHNDDGMVSRKSLYSDNDPGKTVSNVTTPSEINNCDSLKSFLMTDFEANRPIPSDAYEREKRYLNKNDLTAHEYQEECKKAAKRCRI